MTKIATIKSDAIWIRETPSLESNKIGILFEGEEFDIEESKDGWLKHSLGWTLSSDILEFSDKKPKVRDIRNTSKLIQSRAVDVPDWGVGGTPIDSVYDVYNDTTDKVINESTMQNFIKNARGIHGIPYQFMDVVDRRPSGSVFGRKYTEKIVSKMPLLLLTPGRPKFMKGFSSDEKSNILTYLASGGKTDDGKLSQLLEREDGKMYSFHFDYNNYYKFVNPMCQRMARFLGIQDIKLDGTKLDNYKWQDYTNSAFRNFVSSAECVAFYVDSETSISENFSNSTGESMLSSSVNGLSDMARELQFLIGGAAGAEFEALKKENFDSTLEGIQSFTDKYLGFLPDRLMKNLTSGATTVATGGKMLFPEIWNDSNFSRNYNISIKLRTPDMDNYSWFMNIGIPMLHLICLVAPQQMGVNGYQSPFLIRGYYKGFFNCDMGIITDMSIEKGDKGKWTAEGLPTEVDINFTLKDLYQMLTITSSDDTVGLLNNTILLDYLANMCGINVNKPDLERSIDLYFNTFKNSVKDRLTFNGFLGLEQTLSNMINGIFRN